MIKWTDLLEMAISSVFENKFRAILSLLGISIGIAAVFMIFTLSQGGKRVIFSELETLGLNSFSVFRNYDEEEEDNLNSSIPQGHTGITLNNAKMILSNCCAEEANLSPVLERRNMSISLINDKDVWGTVLGVNEAYLEIGTQTLERGRKLNHFDIEQQHKVAVVTTSILRALEIPDEKALSSSISIDNTLYQIVGVLKDKQLNFLSSIGSVNQRGINNQVFLPYNVFLTSQRTDYISYFHGEAADKGNIPKLVNTLTTQLSLFNKARFSYTNSSMEGSINVADNILKNVTLLGLISSCAALFVGGIGIMNMMSTSVVERTSEIGLRKALGATSTDIKKQIIIEALLITLLGSLLGMFFGVLISLGISLLINAPFSISLLSVGISLLITFIVGMLSGYIPANNASKITPIEALNHE